MKHYISSVLFLAFATSAHSITTPEIRKELESVRAELQSIPIRLVYNQVSYRYYKPDDMVTSPTDGHVQLANDTRLDAKTFKPKPRFAQYDHNLELPFDSTESTYTVVRWNEKLYIERLKSEAARTGPSSLADTVTARTVWCNTGRELRLFDQEQSTRPFKCGRVYSNTHCSTALIFEPHLVYPVLLDSASVRADNGGLVTVTQGNHDYVLSIPARFMLIEQIHGIVNDKLTHTHFESPVVLKEGISLPGAFSEIRYSGNGRPSMKRAANDIAYTILTEQEALQYFDFRFPPDTDMKGQSSILQAADQCEASKLADTKLPVQ